MLGLNITQVIVGDVELYVRYRIHNRHALAFAGGYDFNFLDPGSKCDPDHLVTGYGEGENTNEWTTYFYGKGPSARLVYDFMYDQKIDRERFISLTVIAKSRVYEDYQFLPLHDYSAVCESGKQSILGGCVYMGNERQLKNFSIKFYWGTGLRFIWNDVHWEKQELYSIEPEQEDFTRKLIVPSIDGGIIFYFEAARN